MLGVRCWLLDVLVAASPRCAVSQVCNLRIVRKIQSLRSNRRSADYKPALRQIENLRSGKLIPRAGAMVKSKRRQTGVGFRLSAPVWRAAGD